MPISLLQALRDIPLVFVDTETTGASAQWGDRVIELGILRIEGGKTVAQYQQLIDPQRTISPGVSVLTGITQDMVAGMPTFAQQLPATLQLMRDAVIIGHNVRFDLSFLHREFRRSGQELEQALGKCIILDTLQIARKRFGRGGNALQILSRRLGIEPVQAHRALADAQTTARVLESLLEPAGGWNLPLVDVITQQGGPIGLKPASEQQVLHLELEEAMELKKPVRMEYVDANQNRTERIIQPLDVRRFNGEMLLVAHCQLRGAQRTFKLDRIVRLMRIESAG